MNSLYQVCSLVFGNENMNWVDMRNKLFYVLIMSYILASAFIAGHSPCFYSRFTSIGTSVLLFLRLFQYTHKNWYLYFLDVCYYGNILFILASINGADDDLMHANLAFSILILSGVGLYGNSLVPHSLELFTTGYIHVNPAVAVAVTKISKCYEYKCEFTYIVQALSGYYLTHLAFYYLLIFVLLRYFWEKHQIPNLFLYWSADPSIGPIIKSVPKSLQGIMYIIIILASNICIVIISYLLCLSDSILVLTVLINIMYMLYRGANYYLVYLPKRNSRRAENKSN